MRIYISFDFVFHTFDVRVLIWYANRFSISEHPHLFQVSLFFIRCSTATKSRWRKRENGHKKCRNSIGCHDAHLIALKNFNTQYINLYTYNIFIYLSRKPPSRNESISICASDRSNSTPFSRAPCREQPASILEKKLFRLSMKMTIQIKTTIVVIAYSIALSGCEWRWIAMDWKKWH